MDQILKDLKSVNLRGGKRSISSIKSDRSKRSKEKWERGKGAPKKSNPRYKPVMITDKNGNRKKVYKLRKK